MDGSRQTPDGETHPQAPQLDATMELVIRANRGDRQALDDLYARYLPRVVRWAHGRLPRSARGPLETQDLAQETLTKVLQRLPRFEPRHPGAFKDYVYTSLMNEVRDIARRYQRRGAPESIEGDVPADGPSPLEEAIGTETLTRYLKALERLRPEEREAVIARVELGLPMSAVAELLGKPSRDAAHMAVSRALVKLAEEMAHDRKRPRSR